MYIIQETCSPKVKSTMIHIPLKNTTKANIHPRKTTNGLTVAKNFLKFIYTRNNVGNSINSNCIMSILFSSYYISIYINSIVSIRKTPYIIQKIDYTMPLLHIIIKVNCCTFNIAIRTT